MTLEKVVALLADHLEMDESEIKAETTFFLTRRELVTVSMSDVAENECG